ncbi:uncharacterized protein LOC108095971 [Drosophila ficusphila]|uniref:uncharacterized protein LOC108095971 n=1 Tax=Drosophila ficusphila TaxID=30025 RepID=UPI0007E8B550|nr:uncharacterized protein LOC108095971 [Drosophila ficusphila]
MEQFRVFKSLYFIVLLLFMLFYVLVDSACNECQDDNNVKCVNETHFTLCTDGVAPDQVISCPDGQVCTGYSKICWPKGSVAASCDSELEPDVQCPSCDGTSPFVCTSRTTFQFCNGLQLTDQTVKCKDSTYCDIASGKLCVDKCEFAKLGNTFECDREAP